MTSGLTDHFLIAASRSGYPKRRWGRQREEIKQNLGDRPAI
jgi:hypothetical protein